MSKSSQAPSEHRSPVLESGSRSITGVVLFTLLVWLATSLATANDKLMPRLTGLTGYGCSVEQVQDQERWQAYVWAEHDGKRDWKMLYADRHGKHASKKCLEDCDDWVGKVRKLVEADRKSRQK